MKPLHSALKPERRLAWATRIFGYQNVPQISEPLVHWLFQRAGGESNPRISIRRGAFSPEEIYVECDEVFVPNDSEGIFLLERALQVCLDLRQAKSAPDPQQQSMAKKLLSDWNDWCETRRNSLGNNNNGHRVGRPPETLLSQSILSFQNDREPKFFPFLIQRIQEAKTTIRFVGLGRAFISGHEHGIFNAIKEAAGREENLRVEIIMADADNPALKQRVKEEERAHREHKKYYLSGWERSFFESVKNAMPDFQGRIVIRRCKFFPMAICGQVDEWRFFSPYGPPMCGGWEGPWIVLENDKLWPEWYHFIGRMCDEA